MIDELIVRKKKVEKLERTRNQTGISLFILLIGLLFFGFDWTGYGLLGLPIHVKGSFGMLLFVCAAAGVARLMHVTKKTDKADHEFEELREELIQRSEDFWKDDHNWKQRETIFKQLVERYDINLFHR